MRMIGEDIIEENIASLEQYPEPTTVEQIRRHRSLIRQLSHIREQLKSGNKDAAIQEAITYRYSFMNYIYDALWHNKQLLGKESTQLPDLALRLNQLEQLTGQEAIEPQEGSPFIRERMGDVLRALSPFTAATVWSVIACGIATRASVASPPDLFTMPSSPQNLTNGRAQSPWPTSDMCAPAPMLPQHISSKESAFFNLPSNTDPHNLGAPEAPSPMPSSPRLTVN